MEILILNPDNKRIARANSIVRSYENYITATRRKITFWFSDNRKNIPCEVFAVSGDTLLFIFEEEKWGDYVSCCKI